MRFRFLFVDDRGEEVYVSSTEELARHVRSGALREEALLYDALTREWAPARSHPAFARFRETGAAGIVPPGTGEDDVAPPLEEPPSAPPPLDDALPALEPLPEDAFQVDTHQLFLKEQELERWEEKKDEDGGGEDPPLLLTDYASEAYPRHAPISGSWGDTPPEPGDPGFESFLNAQRRWGRSQPPRQWPEAPGTGKAGTSGSGAGASEPQGWAPAATARPPMKPVRKSSSLTRWIRRTRARNTSRSRNAAGRQLALLLVLAAIGGWGVAEAWGVSPLPAHGVDVDDSGAPPLTPEPLPAELRAAEAEAFEGMVAGMERLRERLGVGEPPVTWMGGPYLSNALGFPEVRSYWVRYQDYVDTLRATEAQLFRAGLVTRLRLQGISGPALSIRLARALRVFEADAPRREATYDGMEELAQAALGLHDFLAANAERIRYAPVDQGVNDDPILEAVAEDEVIQEALWLRIERLVEALDSVAAADPLRRRDVSRSVLGSLALPEPR